MEEPKSYRKKPVVIEAWQWLSGLPETTAQDIAEWVNEYSESCTASYDPELSGASGPSGEDWGCLEIDTLEGTMEVAPYDWVIRGVKGEFYPCKPDIFTATYDAS